MKSIIYILLAVFIGSLVVSAFPQHQSTTNTITLKSNHSNISQTELDKSTAVLADRINDLGLQEIDITHNDKNVTIASAGLTGLKDTAILTSKGLVEFYELVPKAEIIHTLKQSKTLTSDLSNTLNFDIEKNVLADCSRNSKKAVDRFIEQFQKNKPNNNWKFYWSHNLNADGHLQLYVLTKKAAVNNKSVLSTSVVSKENMHAVSITFNEQAGKEWSRLTAENIGRPIAITLDREVLSAPVVQSQIKGGKCLITGNFSPAEAQRFKILIGNDALPTSLYIVSL